MTPRPAPPTARPAAGFAIFNLGFRPFYLLAALAAIAGVGLWVMQMFGAMAPAGTVNGMAWHAHEMVFGFAAAVITGFLFTAARNWTGLPTPTGWLLAALCGLWLAGRVVVIVAPWPIAALVDVAFLPAVAVALWVPLQRSRNRNRFLLGLLLVLAAANAVFHLSLAGVLAVPAIDAIRFALYAVVVLITIMGGRVIPSFTANGIPGARVRQHLKFDRAAIAMLAVAMACVLVYPRSIATGVLCLAAAAMHAVRLAGWDPWCTRRTPILWILHLSYAWIPLALLLHALAAFGALSSSTPADHAFAVGAVGGVIIGMITRTARGHSGLPLQVGRLEILAYVLVQVAAVLRVILPIAWPEGYAIALQAAGLCWAVAFALYLFVYTPFLVRARVDGRAG